ncbi:integral membrane sensor signal transduction histidine kinase [Clostridium sp. DL-VIII]|uniref:sensor histidine kinase n=1 Tax=Clostridium sp. DL-VIII TaxID=641107 RepID=UPI00023AF730|nr:HAMP domain-containing sensor histidine kinase [Clostridium sp. DL-VIII]EHI97969.1 integral membrane sensor signal transduction histidine kinase [Clostridium sp. DL-VIII]
METLKKFLMNKYMIAYLYISSILAYFILNLVVSDKMHILLIFRIFYISLSIVIFMFFKQVRKIREEYISRIVIMFFSLMIFICTFEFIMDITGVGIINEPFKGIESSRDSMLLMESFVGYILSEYYLNKRQLKRLSYIVFNFIIILTILTYFDDIFLSFIEKVYPAIEGVLFIKIALSLKNEDPLKEYGWNIIKTYVFYTAVIVMINIYGFVRNDSYLPLILAEVIHLISFRIAWNIVIFQLVRKPYKALSKSLGKQNSYLDELNYKISASNKRLEKSINLLKSKEYLYYTFFKFMPHPIIMLNSENDRIIFVNKQFLKFAGIHKERNIINKHINNYIEFIDRNHDKTDYNAIFHIGSQKKYIEAKYLSNYEDFTKKLLLIKDNTTKVQIEEIKKEVESNKIDESIRKEFLSSISHDLKTPVNVIYSAMQVEKIYIEKADVSLLTKYHNICKQNCISLIKLTNNLIDNSKINSDYLIPRIENINVVEAIEDNVMSLVDYVKLNNIDLIFDTNTEECYLNIDIEFMDRIILNLVSNAVKFTPDGGKIEVILHDRGEKVEILVKDSGSGIDEEFISNAFNRYAVGKNCKFSRKSGTGIGLCVVKQLVELQSGNIEIKRNEDIGTTVKMEFPKGE